MKFIVSSRRATSSEVQNKVKVQRLDSQEFVDLPDPVLSVLTSLSTRRN